MYMLILYTKNNCSYCENVKKAFKSHRIVYEERNISNTNYLAEAKEKGARTMPLLIDTSANVIIRESDEIIDYVLEGSF
jgi:glutaredoxin